ncbi:MAG: hypothetical protein GY810_00275 [Aureispira sp.]|nr:hypothetical protein [Aureispira sp.]
MSKLLFTLTLALLLLSSCKKESTTPECVEDKIKVFKTEVLCSEGAKVEQYSFQSQKVYVFHEGLCIADGTAEVIDLNCKTLGYLGGIMGNNKINGESFSNAELTKTLWKQ